MEQLAGEYPPIEGAAPLDESPAFFGQVQVERFRRQAGKVPKPPPRISTAAEYELIQPGQKYIDPDGVESTKAWRVTDKESYETVPEGADYLDPKGELRVKPKYENVNFTAQTLYSMSLNDKEKYNALAKVYGKEKVKKDEAGGFWYVEEGDTRLRASTKGGKSTARFMGGLASEAAPIGGSILGGIAGGGAGLASTGNPVVAAGTGALGAAQGGAAGAAFNGLIMQLAGVAERTLPEQNADIGKAFMMGAAGEVGGRAVAGSIPAIKAGVQDLSGTAARRVGSFLGADADKEATRTAADLASKGVRVPPSMWMKESPYIQTTVEVFDPTFRSQNVLLQSAEKYYGDEASKLLEQLGVDAAPAQIVKPAAGVSSEAAGSAVLGRVARDVEREDRILNEALTVAKDAMAASHGQKVAGNQAVLSELRGAQERAREAAQKAIDESYKVVQGDVDAAMKTAGVGHNSGDLWGAVGKKLRAVNAGIKLRASKMYQDAHDMGGSHIPNSEELPATAREFLESLPDTFKSKHPDIVKKIEAWSEKVDPKTGEVVKPAETPTFAQLHNLRSQLRSDVDFHDLTPSIREGAYKFFAKRVDNIIHDAGAVPELKTAAKMLDDADKFYGENMKVFQDKSLRTVMSGLKSGEPADPQVLAKTLLKEGHTDIIGKVRDMVGPNLWNAVKAADVQEMLREAQTLVPGQIDGKRFAAQVLDRVQSGLLTTVHGPMGQRLRELAQHIEMLDGRLPMTVRPGDSVAEIIQKAKIAEVAAKEEARINPLGTLESEIKKLESEFNLAAKGIRDIRTDPLAFLRDPTLGATEAANRILAKDDLIYAAASRFRPDSPEFNMLRQVWTERLLQGTMEPGKKLFNTSPEVQAIMFPGVLLKDAQTLARNMEYLMNTKGASASGSGESIAAQSRVQNPWSSISSGGSTSSLGTAAKAVSRVIPFRDAAGRFALTKYYKLLSDGSTHPAFVQWVAKGLEKGDEAAKSKVREAVQLWMNRGGPAGAGAAQAGYQSSGGPDE